MPQTDAILAYLRRHGSITPLEALLPPIGCFRLAARIHDLRLKGHPIRSDLVKRDGKMWAVYSLERPQQVEMWNG